MTHCWVLNELFQNGQKRRKGKPLFTRFKLLNTLKKHLKVCILCTMHRFVIITSSGIPIQIYIQIYTDKLWFSWQYYMYLELSLLAMVTCKLMIISSLPLSVCKRQLYDPKTIQNKTLSRPRKPSESGNLYYCAKRKSIDQ